MIEYFQHYDQFEGYIFDCDGTLAESMYMHFQAWVHALEKHHTPFEFTWDFFRSMAGMGLHHTIKLVNEKFNTQLDADQLIHDQAVYCDQHIDLLERNHEIVHFAEWVAQHKRRLSVASGGHRVVVERTLHILKIDHLFPIVVTQDDVTHGKPDPEIFLLAAQKMGIAPQQCLVLEDSLLGIQAAQAAGMSSVLVRAD